MPVKILYVIDKMVRAGAQRYLSRVVTGLDRHRFEPLVCCLLYPGSLGEELRRQGIPVIFLGLTNIMGVRFARAIGEITALILREKIVLLHSYLFAANLVTPPAGFLAGRPVITSRSDNGFWKKPRHIRALRCANLLTRRITANSPVVVDYLREREKVKPDKILLNLNGIQLGQPPARPTARGPVRLGCLGNIRPVKGYEYLLRALAELKGEWELSIAGRVLDEDYARRLKRLVDDLSLAPRVHFPGEAAEPDTFLSGLDILILPSLSEGFSNALLEAMAAALPVVATTVGANSEMIRERRDGFLVPPGEVRSLVLRLQELIDDPLLRRQMGDSARKRVEEEYSISRTVKRMQSLYQELL